MYLTENDLTIKKQDVLRFSNFKKNKILIDNWAKYSFHDFSLEEKNRKESGSFYTPEWIVRRMVKNSFSILKNNGLSLD